MSAPSNDLKIQTPCPKTWNELEGDESEGNEPEGNERRRFCSACDLHVHNSAALTRAAATELASDTSARVCMRIVQDESGSPVFLDSVTPLKSAPSRLTQVARWALTAGAGLLAACRADSPAPAHPPGDETPNGQLQATLGEVCPPSDPTDPHLEEIIGDVLAPEESDDPSPHQLRETLGRIAPRQPTPPAEDPK